MIKVNRPILSPGYTNAKTKKSDLNSNFLTGIVYLSPYKLSGRNFCAFATKGCIRGCLFTAGMGSFSNVQKARLRRSKLFIQDRAAFLEQLSNDIKRLQRKATKEGKKVCIRLNGTSDLPYHKVKFKGYSSIMEAFPEITFYDYSKDHKRMFSALPSNYDITFSYSEKTTVEEVNQVIRRGKNVAVVFRSSIPKTWMGHRVINGDLTDLRFLDEKGVIVGLTAKGEAKKDDTGFVVDNNDFLLDRLSSSALLP